MTLSTTDIKQAQRTNDAQGPLMLLELSHITWGQTLRLVNDTQTWTSQGLVYSPAPFVHTLPKQANGEAPRIALSLANVGRELTAQLEALPPGGTIAARVLQVFRGTPNAPFYETYLDMTAVTINAKTLEASLTRDTLDRRSAGVFRYDPNTFAGLFSQ